ncbi:MAG: hypothetical protein RSC76_02980 [Oscillospiraceae bacterium]
MGEKNIKKEARKPKKSDKNLVTTASASKPVFAQPELIKKERKPK